MGAVQRLATVVIVGLVALATVLVLYLADEGNRVAHEQEEQEEAAIERGRENYITLCMQCHGPAGEGYAAAGEAGTSRIGAPIGGNEAATRLNQEGITSTGDIYSDPDFGSGVEGRANYIRNRIVNGQIIQGNVLMPAFGEDKNGPLNDEQVEELIVFIQHSDWNETYNEAVAEYDGYPTAAPQPTQAGEGDAQPTEAANPDAATALTVTMYDNYFEPANFTIPADQEVTINLVNAGNAQHIFRVDALNIESEAIQPGGEGSVTLTAPAGDHEIRCPVPGHTELGMVGTMTADPNAAPPGGGAAAPAEAPAADPAAAEQPPAEGAPAADAAASGEPIRVEMNDMFQFLGVPETIPANTDVVVTAVNVGAAQHNFAIEGQPGMATPIVGGGQEASVTINLPPGTYTYICEVPGHKELGMVGTLTVQ